MDRDALAAHEIVRERFVSASFGQRQATQQLDS